VEEESQIAINPLLTEFFNIILQADDTTILPPFLDFDRDAPEINVIQNWFLSPSLSITSQGYIQKQKEAMYNAA
jgi:hypothetical protein